MVVEGWGGGDKDMEEKKEEVLGDEGEGEVEVEGEGEGNSGSME